MSFSSNKWGDFSIASRLRYLFESLNRDVDLFYLDNCPEFKTRFYPVVHLLNKQQDQTIKALAEQAGYSHSAMSQTLKQMANLGLVQSKPNIDGREKQIALTPTATELIKKLQPIWETIAQANQSILEECQVDFLHALEQFESALDRQSMYERLNQANNKTKKTFNKRSQSL